MKKIFLAFCIVSFLSACNSEGSKNDPDATHTDTTDKSMLSTTPYEPTGGDVTYRDKQLLEYHDGKWEQTNNSVTMGNGIVINTDGTIKNGERVDTLTEGEIVSHTGDLYDKAGNAIHDAWNAGKQGANDAGDAVKKGANDATDAAKEGVNKAGEGVGKGLNAAGQAANNAVKDTKDAMDKK